MITVATPEELLAAVQRGVQHIEVTDHLDLTTLEPPGDDYEVTASENAPDILLGVVPQAVKSIRVCTRPYTFPCGLAGCGASECSRTPRRCKIL